MADGRDDTAGLRSRAEDLLARARTQSNQLRQALGATQRDPALQARLSAAAAEMAGIADALSQSLGGPAARSMPSISPPSRTRSVRPMPAPWLPRHQRSRARRAATALRVETASIGTRHEVQALSHDLFNRHLFEPYLHFASAEDETEFRHRETEAKAYVEAQLARGKPEGNLNASGGTLGYMLDAHAHGAGDSPEFQPRWNALADKADRQREAMRAAGQSTEEFDRTVTASVRRVLERKGLTHDQIARVLADKDPVAAATATLALDGAGHGPGAAHPIEAGTPSRTALPEVKAGSAERIEAPATPLPIDVMAAKLKAAGVQMTDTAEITPAHGVTVQKKAGAPGLGGG